MPLHEKAYKCHNCGNDLLRAAGPIARWDSFRHGGGPGQQPNIMGKSWDSYECMSCGFIGPWNKFYSISPQLQQEYKEILQVCKEKYKDKQAFEKQLEMVKGMIEASKELKNLPGGSTTIEQVMEYLQPILDNQAEKIKSLEQEAKRRRGGRPKKATSKKASNTNG